MSAERPAASTLRFGGAGSDAADRVLDAVTVALGEFDTETLHAAADYRESVWKDCWMPLLIRQYIEAHREPVEGRRSAPFDPDAWPFQFHEDSRYRDERAFTRGFRASTRLSYHDDFARCPECGNATVGIHPPWAINHERDCKAALALPEGHLD